MTYSHEAEVEANGAILNVVVHGRIEHDSGMTNAYGVDGKVKALPLHNPRWAHDGYDRIEVIGWADCGEATEELAEQIYEVFCEENSAEDLAEKYAPEPDFDAMLEARYGRAC